MVDRNGITLKQDDRVAFVAGVGTGATIELGKIKRIYPDKDACTVYTGKDRCCRMVYPKRILKLDSIRNEEWDEDK